MKKNKKLIMLLALNSLTVAFADAKNSIESKYDKLYNNMTKNIESGKSNDKNYKLIEDVLNKRNQELKDLYMQSDYIIKPEYLEWQVFFSGFYNSSHRGGNKESVRSIVPGEAKKIDLGMVIPVSGITRDKLDLNITPINEPVINININPLVAPQITAPIFTYTDITFPGTPNASTPYFSSQNSYQAKAIGGYSSSVAYYTSGNKIFENLNVESTGGTTLALDGKTNTIAVTGSTSYANGAYTGTSAPSYTHTGYSNQFAAHNIGTNGNYEIKGNWNMTMTDGPTYNQWGFLSYRPYYANTDTKALFSGNLNLEANNTTGTGSSTSLIGMSLNLSSMTANPTTTATMENSGTITIKNGTQSGQSCRAMD